MPISEILWPEERVEHIAACSCVVIEFRDGRAYPVTARKMTANEKRRYAA
jgi:hypothetical protein